MRGIQRQWLSAGSPPEGPISEQQHRDTHAPYATRGTTNQMVTRPDHVVWPNSDGSCSSGPFSREQLMEYNQNGYLMLKDFFSKDEIQEMLKITHNIRERYNQEILGQDSDITVTETSRMVTEETGRKIKYAIFFGWPYSVSNQYKYKLEFSKILAPSLVEITALVKK